MKKFKLFLVLISVFSLLPTLVEAKVSINIGTAEYNGPNSSQEATYAYNKTKGMGYTGHLSITPTVTTRNTLTNALKNSSDGGVAFFLGHANSDKITWQYNGNTGAYKVGLTRNGSMCTMDGFDLLSTSAFITTKTQLAVMMGCGSANNSTNNIAKTANSNGAKVSMGWVYTIYDGDTDTWVTRFYDKLAAGTTIKVARDYANSYSSYYDATAIKTQRVYGNESGLTITTTSYKSAPTTEATTKEDFENLASMAEVKAKTYSLNAVEKNTTINVKSNNTKDLVINYVQKSFDSKLNANDYKIDVTENDGQLIYDMTLLVNGFQTTVGYTVIIENGEVIVFDNMNSKTKDIVVNNFATKKSTKVFDEKSAIEKAIKENPTFDTTTITFDSTQKIYDVEDGKLYFLVHLKEFETEHETVNMRTVKFEM